MALGKLNRLDVLAELYGEVVLQGFARGAPDALIVSLFWQRQGWPVVEVSPEILSTYEPPVILDPGEREVLALAQTLTDPLVLLDDEVARSEARRLELRVRGTVGVFVQALRRGLLSLSQVELFAQRDLSSTGHLDWIQAMQPGLKLTPRIR
jgi:predicted nucleic acid-binding protein